MSPGGTIGHAGDEESKGVLLDDNVTPEIPVKRNEQEELKKKTKLSDC